ncbi:MAG: hypothetical protein L3J19_03770 [Sulfurimonas sp.]|nr:hypothetical protein [Sulfurimonas sp.]
MNKKSKIILYSFMSLSVLLCLEAFYIYSTKSVSSDSLSSKLAFVELVGLPDLAISTEATYVRHRSMSDLFSIYKDDGTLREYFPSTFVYAHSHAINKEVQ